MKKHVYEQVRPVETCDAFDWLLADAEEPGADEVPTPVGVRWTVKLDDWYLTPPVGFIPRVRVVL